MPSSQKKTPRTRRPGTGTGADRSTRTSSRSAKRRSPKERPPDPELLEQERLEFLRAMDRYKRKTGKTFPTWTEVLDVLRSIGWVSPAKLELERKQTAG